MRMNLKPWRMALPGIGFVILAALWSAFWYWSQDKAQSAVNQWRSELAAQSIIIECSQETWGGYPFRIEIQCTPGRIEKDGEAVIFTKLTILAQIYNPNHILAVNDGETHLITKQGITKFNHEGAIASLILTPEGHAQADIEFTKITNEKFSAESFTLHSRHRSQLMDVAARLTQGQIADHAVAFGFTGAISPLPSGMRLSDFAAMQSQLIIDQIDLSLDGANFTGNGNLTLENNGLPEGKLGGRIRNLPTLIKNFSVAGLIKEDQAQGANFLFGLLGANSDKGVKIDLLARDGMLYLGPIQIGKLRPLF